MDLSTLQALRTFPERLRAFYEAVPADCANWTPRSWNGVPSESLTPIEQICHVRDIEIDGYRIRLRRTLSESDPFLPAVDGYRLARERAYARADAGAALADFAQARAETMELISTLGAADFDRPAVFEDYGTVTLRGLVHLLCSHDQQHLAGLQWLLAGIAAERGR